MNFLSLIISSAMNVIVLVYICKFLLNKKLNYFSKEYILTVFSMTIYWAASYIVTNDIFRILVSFLLLVSACLLILKEKTSKSVIVSFLSLIILLISEIMYAILLVFILKVDIGTLRQTIFGNFISNLSILLLSLAITQIICYKTDLKNKIDKITMNNKNSNLYIFSVAFATILMLVYCIYFEADLLTGLIFGIIIVIVYVIFTISLVQEKSSNSKLQEENNNMILSLEEYEKMYAFQRMKNHEYKNDLSVLRGMIDKENKKALKYIDEIIDFKTDEKHNLMETLKRIPEGGLQGILYYKLLQMEELKADIEFVIGTSYRSISYNRLSEEIKAKVCKLIGIYLDNAIQAVKNLKTKNIYIEISDNKELIIFKIANNFAGKIDLDKIDKMGYTTKENGNGYGLAIAKKLLEDTEEIKNNTSVVKDKFIQEIKIKKCS